MIGDRCVVDPAILERELDRLMQTARWLERVRPECGHVDKSCAMLGLLIGKLKKTRRDWRELL
jgi:murein endopeptidase